MFLDEIIDWLSLTIKKYTDQAESQEQIGLKSLDNSDKPQIEIDALADFIEVIGSRIDSLKEQNLRIDSIIEEFSKKPNILIEKDTTAKPELK